MKKLRSCDCERQANPMGWRLLLETDQADVAQLVEQLIRNQ